MLSNKEIQLVENWLDNVLTYDDLKLEVLDHFTSDIESQIDRGIVFEDTFVNVKLKWQNALRNKTSIYFGKYYAPKILIDKAKSVYKHHVLVSVFLMLSPLFFKAHFTTTHTMIFNVFWWIVILFRIYLYWKMKQSKNHNVYSFIIKSQTDLLPTIAAVAILLFLTNKFLVFISLGLVYNVIVLSIFYKRHLKLSKTFQSKVL